jgi:hypothetical protein
MPDDPIVSHRELMGRCALVGFLVQLGSSPHLRTFRCRSAISGSRRITAASYVGQMFQLGAVFSSGLVVRNSRAIARS